MGALELVELAQCDMGNCTAGRIPLLRNQQRAGPRLILYLRRSLAREWPPLLRPSEPT